MLEEKAAAAADSAEGVLTAARSTHVTIERIAEHWDRRAALHKRRDEFADERPAIDTDRKTFRLAGASEALRQVLDVEHHHRDELAQCTTLVNEQIAAVADRCDEAPSLPDGLATPAADETPTVQDLSAIGTALAVHRVKLDDFAADATKAAGLESRGVTERDAEADHRQGSRSRRPRLRQSTSNTAEAAEAALIKARSATDRVADLQAAADRATERAEAAAELAKLKIPLDAATTALTAARQVTLDRRSAALDLREQHLKGIAAVLAGTLTNDAPCPVCGSTDHPEPGRTRRGRCRRPGRQGSRSGRGLKPKRPKLEPGRRNTNLPPKPPSCAEPPVTLPMTQRGAAEQADEATAQVRAATGLAKQVDELDKAVTAHREAVTAAEQCGEAGRSRCYRGRRACNGSRRRGGNTADTHR